MFRQRGNSININNRPGTSPASNGSRENGAGPSPIVELQQCVKRMNFIVQLICESYKKNVNRSGSNNGSPYNFSPSKSPGGGRIGRGGGGGGRGRQGLKFSTSSFDTIDSDIDVDADFIKLNVREEEEMIELLRRIAELVVQGEQRAAVDDTDISTSASSEQQQQQIETGNGNAIFEYFCEANILGTIINIVTGAAFSDDDRLLYTEMGKMDLNSKSNSNLNGDDGDGNSSSDNEEEFDEGEGGSSRHVLLPPISIAIQAIQSVSILVQNVAKVTSLYFILSNNKVNDLINLPLGHYIIAETNRDDNVRNRNGNSNGLRRSSAKPQSQSAEMSELTTLFVSFLKSLAMRMNPETLQFYISYPMLNKNDVDYGAIQFPLYARALEFCHPDVDNFVRVTAMNICLNTLRLATNGDPLSATAKTSSASAGGDGDNKNGGNDNDDKSTNNNRPDRKFSPDGSSLHLTKALPFRERLAISHYVCLPSNVQGLTSATFTKIGQLCGLLEETIRSMDRIDWALSELSANEKKKKNDLQIDRIQLVKEFQDLAADFQDEFFLLEDVLAVGLVPLNEQIIEMMFGAVVYPLVLQPLQIYTNRDSANSKVKTNQVADVSLAKAAFFFIGSIYHFISHKPFLHLLLTALFHPLSPEQSKSLIETDTPTIVQIYDNGDIQIKTDKQRDGGSLNCYVFGRDSGDSDTSQMPGTKLLKECTYVLSPALAQLYDGDMFPQTSRQNSYRRSILASLSGTDGMAILQPLAIYAVDAILATIKPEILNNIMFGANIHPELEVNYNRSDSDSMSVSSTKSGTENYMVEVIASVCRSIMTDTELPNGK